VPWKLRWETYFNPGLTEGRLIGMLSMLKSAYHSIERLTCPRSLANTGLRFPQEYEPGKQANCLVDEKGRIMNEQEILDILRAEKPYLSKKFGLLSIGLFGSFAKGTQGPESDIDLLVEIIEPRFDFLAGIQLHLEKKIGKPVDVVRKRSALGERFLKQVGKTIRYA
jgi:predicted nucleotidyltransferase